MVTPEPSNSETTTSDRDLLLRFVKKRDEAAFRLLVARHHRLVWCVCRRMLSCQQDREDVFQATFLKLWVLAEKRAWHESLGGWLHRVAFLLSLKSRCSRKREDSLDVAEEPWIESTCLAQIQRQDAERALHEAIAQLPRRERRAIVLHYFQNKSQEEVAAEMGGSLSAIKSLLQRSRRRLYLRLSCRGLSCSAALLALEQTLSAAPPVFPKVVDKVVSVGRNYSQTGGHTVGSSKIEQLSLGKSMSILHSGVVNKSLVVVSCTALLWLSIEMTTGLNDTDLIQAESLNAHQKVTETEAKLAARNFTQGQTPASAEELTPEQMKRLIAKLGAQSFAEREAAANRLLQIGEPATPFLRGAISKSKDRTIQHLAKQTLDSIRDQSSNEMRKAFVSGEAQATLPGWKPYREIVGDTPWSRAFFICMYDNHRQLLEAYESDAMQASQLLARLCDEREHDTNAAEPTLLASALLVGQDKKVPISLGTQALLKLILRHSSVSLNEVTLDNSHKVLRALAAALFNQSREVVLENGSPWPLSKSHVTLYDMEQLGLQPEIGIMVVNDLRAFEGQIAPNRDKLNRKAAPNADILIGEWIYALGRFGDQSHLAVLEPWLKHSELTGLGSGQLVETRNVALAAMVHLSGQNGFEYGFSERFDDKPPLDPASRSRASCSLVDGKDFETALAQWRDWSEKHAPKAAVPPQ